MYSKAKLVEVEETACERQSKMHIFAMKDWHGHSDCMRLCENLGGRSPPVKTLDEWQKLNNEFQLITSRDASKLPKTVWLSATEGDKDQKLERLDHWPENLGVEEGIWRDYYSGDQLEGYSKPWATENKLAKARTTRTRPGTLGLKNVWAR